MSGWLAPGLAAALWAGLAVRPIVGERLPVWAWLAAGAALAAAALAMAPARASGPEALRSAGLLPAGRRQGGVETVRPRRPLPGRLPPWLALASALAAASLLGIGWGSAHAHRTQGAVLARLAPAQVAVEGALRTDPRARVGGWSAIVDVRTVRAEAGSWSVREVLWVGGRGDPPEAVRGDRVRLEGEVALPQDAGFADFLLRRGVAAELSVGSAVRVGPSDLAPVRWAQAVRAVVGRQVRALFPPREAGLLLGLSLGDDSMLDAAVERDFRATGLSHLLVVSGGNVAMVLAPALALASLLRLPRWPRFAIGGATVGFFVVLTGAEPSVLRAGVMAWLALTGTLLGRPRSTGAILSVAVSVLLVLDPALVWSIGFQLSVAATAGIVALAGPLAERLRVLPRAVAVAAGATLGAQLGVAPVLLFHFHEVPLSTIVANLLAVPAVSPAMLLGLAAAGGALVAPLAGPALAALAQVPLRYLEAVADRLAGAPVPWVTGGGATTLVLGLGGAAALAWWLRSRRRLPRALLAVGLAAAPLLLWSRALSAGPPPSLTVRFFDVGQGDAALVTSPAGAAVLVDGGPDEAQVATELAALGVKRLDAVVATHPHADHIAGLPAVLARFPVGVLLEPGCPDDTPEQEELRAAVAAEGIRARHPRAGDTLVVGDVRLDVLAPAACFTGTGSDTNNDSLVVLVSRGGDSVLFTGDVEEPAQRLLLDAGTPLDADVLKVPHHGGATSLPAFLEAPGAGLAVVSTGPNAYGHPVPAVLGWLRAAGARVVRTDLAGDVVVSFEEGRVVVASGG